MTVASVLWAIFFTEPDGNFRSRSIYFIVASVCLIFNFSHCTGNLKKILNVLKLSKVSGRYTCEIVNYSLKHQLGLTKLNKNKKTKKQIKKRKRKERKGLTRVSILLSRIFCHEWSIKFYHMNQEELMTFYLFFLFLTNKKVIRKLAINSQILLSREFL